LGAALHHFIAFVVPAPYYAATVKIPLFMNGLVLPLSAVAKTPFSWRLYFNGIIGHALFIGIPIAVFAAAPRARVAAVIRAGRPLAA
jgi:hypothetical protein